MANTKKWLARNEVGSYLVIERNRTPRKPITGWRNWRGKVEYPCHPCVETLLPETMHLSPGGGPVELET
jgi:hypothetical protein